MKTINFGDTLTCTETGKQFIAAQDGCSTNYARNGDDEIFSDEGVDIREKRELLDRSKPFFAYLSSDGRSITGWKGNKLASAISWNGRVGYCRDGCYVNAVDVHGQKWHGKNGGKGMAIVLRPSKA